MCTRYSAWGKVMADPFLCSGVMSKDSVDVNSSRIWWRRMHDGSGFMQKWHPRLLSHGMHNGSSFMQAAGP